MTYQVLARKWRPRTFDQLVGQEHVSQALINGLDQDRLHHAFLFTGTRGVGKTTIARILAKCLNCEVGMSSQPCGDCGSCVDVDEGRFVDMIEIDAASRTGVDDMRELLESVQYTPTRGRYKIYIIDEVHMLSSSSFNALLKTLEEPPPHVKFVLATTDPQKIPVTILSRCLRFNLRRLLPDQIRGYLETLVESESIETEPETLTVLSRAADGSMRDGLSLLDQAIAYGGGRLAMDDLEKMLGLVDHEHVASIVRKLAEGDPEGMLNIVEDLVSQSRDLDSVLVNLAELLHRVTLVQCVPGYRDPERSDWPAIEKLASSLSAEDAQLYYQIAIKGRNELGLAPDPRTGLEMTLLRMLAFRPAEGGSPPKTQAPAGARHGGRTGKPEPVGARHGGRTAEPVKPTEPAPAPPEENAVLQSPSATEQFARSSGLLQKKPESVGARFSGRTAEPEPAGPRHGERTAEPVKPTEPAPAPPEENAVLQSPSATEQFARSSGLLQKEPEPVGARFSGRTDTNTPAAASDNDWLALIEQLGISGQVRELARNIELKDRKGDTWEFVIIPALKHLGSKNCIERLQKAICEHQGREIRLRLVDDARKILRTAAAKEQAQIHQNMSEAEKAIQDDPTVKDLKEKMGARIVDDSIQPIQ